jgi:hypothetical protein
MRSANPSTPFAATSGEKILQARKPETSRFYILSEKTWRTSAVTIWLHPHTTISAINDVSRIRSPAGCECRRGAIVWRVCPKLRCMGPLLAQSGHRRRRSEQMWKQVTVHSWVKNDSGFVPTTPHAPFPPLRYRVEVLQMQPQRTSARCEITRQQPLYVTH